ncbi:MAG: hypothetical protein QF842_04085 [Candidatus Marinimicrobia bacterium]|jgi:hypothetical protein|nr:hypothetical protein [Candidatus Neomarinimicrobiota bacterium]MDP6611741.1 hypothetical protein [Candidatus Neomarinimicrobiota bacterium]|tara:strand:- start:68535 stop:71498 length:2964 start_codon:yes stop_codon:yes gene_type:complete
MANRQAIDPIIMHQNPCKPKITLSERLSKSIIGFVLLLIISCDFQNPVAFEMPTWFFDLTFPLIQKKYSLEGMVDNKQIFSTPDSIGMQLMFEGTLPDTSFGTDILEVDLNQNIQYTQPATATPNFSFSLDTTINLTIPIAPGGKLTNSSGTIFSVPPSTNQKVNQSIWNTIASAFDTTIQVIIDLPQIPSSQLPSFIQSVNGLVIQTDDDANVSDFVSTFTNDGLPTNVTNPTAALVTDITSPPKSLANHTQATLAKDVSYGPTTTSLSHDSLGNAIRMDIGFGIATTSNATVAINAGDNVQVNVAIRMRIAGVDSAIVQVRETSLPMSLPKISFPTDIEIYGGQMKSLSTFEVNEINIKSISSTYPLNVDFDMNFRNFVPPAGKDSTKIDTVLKKGVTISKVYKLDGYTFRNPAGNDKALSELTMDISAVLPAQTAKIPLDGSNIGGVSLDVALKKLHFETLEANIIQEFPSTTFSILGMPLGFSGMTFTDTKLEIEMNNSIRLPVVLDFDMLGINQEGDSMKVNALSTLASPTSAGDTTKTIVRLSRDGTTTLKYKSPASVAYYDSSTVPPKTGQTTIVDLMSSSSAVFNVESRARIDGRGTLEAGMSIGGKYKMLAPFEVIMAPMTFISVTNTPVQEMNHSNRNRIRSTLQAASLDLTVENKIPSGGELAMLMSNLGFFPLDTTASALASFKDSMVVKRNWAGSDSVYIVTKCDSLNPATGNYFIFDVMDDIADCVEGMAYLVKTSGSGMDTVVSYVDTLLKIPLPDPVSFYPATNASVHAGQVKDPGFAMYSSPVPTTRIKLMTNPGQPYMAPRFHLNGSNGKKVYFSTADYIDINSNITFSLSSTGMTSAVPDELVVKYPNGNQTLNKDTEVIVKWKTFGTIDKVDLAYYAGTDPDMNKDEGWTDITTELANVDSFDWTPSNTSGINSMSTSLRDSVRIRVKSTDGKVRDISGWYFTISHSNSKIQNNSKIVHFEGKPYKR